MIHLSQRARRQQRIAHERSDVRPTNAQRLTDHDEQRPLELAAGEAGYENAMMLTIFERETWKFIDKNRSQSFGECIASQVEIHSSIPVNALAATIADSAVANCWPDPHEHRAADMFRHSA